MITGLDAVLMQAEFGELVSIGQPAVSDRHPPKKTGSFQAIPHTSAKRREKALESGFGKSPLFSPIRCLVRS